MAFANIVAETTNTQGTGSYTPTGALFNTRTLEALVTGQEYGYRVYYADGKQPGVEVGRGIYDGAQLGREVIEYSSNNDQLVNWNKNIKIIEIVLTVGQLEETQQLINAMRVSMLIPTNTAISKKYTFDPDSRLVIINDTDFLRIIAIIHVPTNDTLYQVGNTDRTGTVTGREVLYDFVGNYLGGDMLYILYESNTLNHTDQLLQQLIKQQEKTNQIIDEAYETRLGADL